MRLFIDIHLGTTNSKIIKQHSLDLRIKLLSNFSQQSIDFFYYKVACFSKSSKLICNESPFRLQWHGRGTKREIMAVFRISKRQSPVVKRISLRFSLLALESCIQVRITANLTALESSAVLLSHNAPISSAACLRLKAFSTCAKYGAICRIRR